MCIYIYIYTQVYIYIYIYSYISCISIIIIIISVVIIHYIVYIGARTAATTWRASSDAYVRLISNLVVTLM